MNINSYLINEFPSELQYKISEYLKIGDLNKIMQVSKAWYKLFSSNLIWEPIAKSFNIGKLRVNRTYELLIHKNLIINWLCRQVLNNNDLVYDYRSLVRKQLILIDERKINFAYGYIYLSIFKNVKVIQNLTHIKIELNQTKKSNKEMIDRLTNAVNNQNPSLLHEQITLFQFEDKCFRAPMVRVTLSARIKNINFEGHFILLRIYNHTTKEIIKRQHHFSSSYFYSSHPQKVYREYGMPWSAKKIKFYKQLFKGKPVELSIECSECCEKNIYQLI